MVEEYENTKEVRRSTYAKRGVASEESPNLDSVHKEVILRERKLRDEWSRKYAHLTREYFRKVLAEKCKEIGLPADTFQRKCPEELEKNSPVCLASPPIPITTSATVGWRSSRPECNLEFVGPFYVSPKSTIEPPCRPGENPRPKQQAFIFLG